MPRNDNRFNKKVFSLFFVFSFGKMAKLFGLPSQPKCMKWNQCVYRRQVHILYGNGILFFTCFWKFLSFVFYSQNENTVFFRASVCLCSYARLVSYRNSNSVALHRSLSCTHIHTSHTSVRIRNENAFLLSGIAWKTYETTHACTALCAFRH